MLERSNLRMKVKGRKIKRPKQYKKLRNKRLKPTVAARIANSKRRKRR